MPKYLAYKYAGGVYCGNVMAVEYELRKGIDSLSRSELGDFNIAANEALHELSMEYNNSCEAIGRYTH